MFKLLKPALLLAAIGVMVIGMIGSGAWWSDTVTTSTTNAISSGTLSIDDAKIDTFNIGTIERMAPGELTPEISIIIENNGTVDLGWFGDLLVGDNELKNVIYIDHAKMEFLTPAGAAWEPFDEFILNGKGHGAWPTNWSGPENYATLAAFNGNGNMAPGTGYEFMGALKPAYKYKLTLRFGFYPGAGNEYQGKGPLTLGFKVIATQINAGALNSMLASGGNHVTWMTQQIAKQTIP
jgi:hypothetical protein